MADFKAPQLPAGRGARSAPPAQEDVESSSTQPEASLPAIDRAFSPPSWCAVPPSPCFLEVIKDGVIADKIDLALRDHSILGRLPTPVIEISVDNPVRHFPMFSPLLVC